MFLIGGGVVVFLRWVPNDLSTWATRKRVRQCYPLSLFSATMAQQMEIDFDVPKFLHDERQKAPSQLQHYFTTFEDLYERKWVALPWPRLHHARPRVPFAHAWCYVPPLRLWHQLTQSILEFFEQPESTPHQIPIFQQFIAEWESKINKLSLVQIALRAASNCSRKYGVGMGGWMIVIILNE